MSCILILGANSDIAKAIAHEYARHGFSIILASRDQGQLEQSKIDIENRFSVNVHCLVFDAESIDMHKKFVSSIAEDIDVAICAFGVLHNQKCMLDSTEYTRENIGVNYVGAVSILNCIALKMRESKKGSVIGLSSVAGERGRQSNFIYGSAKAGFTIYLEGLRNYLFSFGVHVMTVKLGFVRTKMIQDIETPGWLTSTPEQVAHRVYRAQQKGKHVIYVSRIWQPIMFVIRNIPNSIFIRLKL